jgi:CheY-like chemotaxis protein
MVSFCMPKISISRFYGANLAYLEEESVAKKRVLIIDDEKDICESLEAQFAEEGFVVDLAYNGQEGLEKLHAQKPDVIILDIFMPVMDGVTFLHQMRDEEEERGGRTVPVIVMTGCYLEGLMKELPVTAVAAKPVFFEELLKKVNQCIEDITAS